MSCSNGYIMRYAISEILKQHAYNSYNSSKIQKTNPLEYEDLEMDALVLPGNHFSLVHPFLSLVINLNVVTQGHRDAKDKSMCLVLAIGDFTGGDICLYEPGLVISLRNGDFILFPSFRLTHFNLHFVGQRASMVLHTDKEMDKWTQGGRNGWETNETFV